MQAFSARIAILFAPVAFLATAGEAETGPGYHCVIESVRNTSLAMQLPVEEPERFFPSSELTREGDTLTLYEETTGEVTEGMVTHSIDPATGDYAATTMLTDHSMGEQYVIATVGGCERRDEAEASSTDLRGKAERPRPLSLAHLAAGRELFRSIGCAQCHTLGHAGSRAGAAPSLDANPGLSKPLVLERLTYGQGDMPAFTGLLTDEQMVLLADYVTTVTARTGGIE